jgi:membrane associated rhomboid family serine protease
MADIGIVGFILIIVNVVLSYKGFTNELFFDGYKFEVDRVLISKDYKRLITSGFLHVSWNHLIFNMISLYAFSGLLEFQIGGFYFLIIYFASLVGGNLLALFVHRYHGDYSSVGASGAICGVIFASIALFPGLGIGFFMLPFSMPSWLYGIIYVAYSIYGIKSSKDNIGHEAHLGGALIGMLIAIMLKPSSLTENYLPILVITAPTIAFIYLIVSKPHILLVDNFFFKTHKKYYDIDHKYNEQKINKQNELDNLLDKISNRGIESLTTKEKQKLEEYSK